MQTIIYFLGCRTEQLSYQDNQWLSDFPAEFSDTIIFYGIAVNITFIELSFKNNDRNNPKHWDRQVSAKSVDPDQMLQCVASDQGLHCLPLIQYFFLTITCKTDLLKCRDEGRYQWKKPDTPLQKHQI